ncbi:MAG TPA: hypothetical protein VGU02_12410, partial [Gaiellaceae bacterium]|nr:hypothetical protein [Gaiellaceae bacterium]
MWYQDWTQPLVRPYYLDDALGRGATPIVTWEPDVAATENEVQPAYALSAIVAGKYDAYLWAQARAAASYGKPFSVRLGHEMNGDWYSWGAGLNGNTPDLYVKFWK